MRFIRRLVSIVLGAAAIILLTAACMVLRYQAEPSIYPPPLTAVPSTEALAVTSRVAAQPVVNRTDLAIDLAPSRADTVQLYVDGKNFYPAMLEDMKAAQSSIHFEEYGFDPGQVAD